MKKIVSLVIVLTMMLCMFPISSMTASAETTEFKGLVDLSNKTQYPDGGSYTDPKTDITYTVVRSANKLIEVVKADLTGNYILAENIKTTSTYKSPMFGNTNDTFTGVLDGNGFAIYGFTTTYPSGWSYQGGCVGVLFNNIGGNATIKNLSVGRSGENVQVTVSAVGAGMVGVIAGKIASSTTAENTVTISNVNVYADISYTAKKEATLCVGGIIGKTDRPSSSNVAYRVNINDTNFYGSISFTQDATVSGYSTYVGGMVGYFYGGGSLSIQRSSNYANVDTTNRASVTSPNANAYAGGIVGYIGASATISDCLNTGNVIADKYCGGIIGSAKESVSFNNCVNYGIVASNRFAGGIVAAFSFSESNTYEFNFENCINNGNISSSYGEEPPSGSKFAAGGIIGWANFGIYSLNNCGNTGNISADNAKSSGEIRAAGMIGNSYTSGTGVTATINNCFSTGTISSSLKNDTRELTAVALCSGSTAGTNFVLTNCVWNMTFNGAKIAVAGTGKVTIDSTNTSVDNKILAKETANEFEARAQMSEDGTMLRVLLLTKNAELDANEPVVIKIYQGNTGKQFTVPASSLFALEEVNAADEIYCGFNGTLIFGAVIKGLPSDVTDATVEYAGQTFNFDLSK